LNGDDYLYPHAVARLVAAMQRTHQPWAIGRLRWVDGADRSLGEMAPPPSRVSSKVLASLGWNWMYHQTTYMRADFFSELGGFDTRYRVNADFDLLLRARQRSVFVSVNELTAAFRRHGANLSITGPSSDTENDEISRTYGPRSATMAEVTRLGVRCYVNARNPQWSFAKRLPRRRSTA
jgi:hypothetical protein